MSAEKKQHGNKLDNFEDTYNTYYSLIFSLIYKKLGNYDEAEDICQEVFIRFYNKFDEIENYRTWLFGAIRIVMLDYFKQKKPATTNIDNLLDDVSISYVNGFKDTRIMIQDALTAMGDSCNEKERTVFELVAIHNFTFIKASKHLKLTYDQVRYAFEQATKKIITHFNNKGVKSLEDLL